MICITIQRTLSVAKVRYLIGDKECFKIFYPRFFAWVNLFLLNHILLYSLLYPFQSIQTYVKQLPTFNIEFLGLIEKNVSHKADKLRSTVFLVNLPPISSHYVSDTFCREEPKVLGVTLLKLPKIS